MAFRTEILEAIDPSFTIANRIMNKMNWAEIADISDHNEINKEYIRRRAAKYCHSFDTLSDEVQDKVIERIWNRLKRNAPEKTEEAKPANREELKQKIEDYFAHRDGLEFSTAEVAEDLASLLSGEESELNEDSTDIKKFICTSLGGLTLGPIGLLAVEGLLNTKKGLKWLKGKRISSKK
jgi:DNA-directed RNA polymerase subunit F